MVNGRVRERLEKVVGQPLNLRHREALNDEFLTVFYPFVRSPNALVRIWS